MILGELGSSRGDQMPQVIHEAWHWPFIERPDVLLPAVDRFLNGEWPAGAELLM